MLFFLLPFRSSYWILYSLFPQSFFSYFLMSWFSFCLEFSSNYIHLFYNPHLVLSFFYLLSLLTSFLFYPMVLSFVVSLLDKYYPCASVQDHLNCFPSCLPLLIQNLYEVIQVSQGLLFLFFLFWLPIFLWLVCYLTSCSTHLSFFS